MLVQSFSTGSKPTGSDFENLIDTLEVTDLEKQGWNKKSDFDGKYSSLSEKPTIPTKTSELTNDSNLETTTGSQGKADGALESAKSYTDSQLADILVRLTALENSEV
ncbi:hypothetical protein [Viridibacillus arvi]|uniref:hypothetical protein n=1 Tax=Viridibacillus arvi TaxID=263475 RepID=UPI0034D017E0